MRIYVLCVYLQQKNCVCVSVLCAVRALALAFVSARATTAPAQPPIKRPALQDLTPHIVTSSHPPQTPPAPRYILQHCAEDLAFFDSMVEKGLIQRLQVCAARCGGMIKRPARACSCVRAKHNALGSDLCAAAARTGCRARPGGCPAGSRRATRHHALRRNLTRRFPEPEPQCPRSHRRLASDLKFQIQTQKQDVAEKPFATVTYTEAIKLLQKSGHKFEYPVSWGLDMQSEHERFLSETVRVCVFVRACARVCVCVRVYGVGG